VIEKAPRIPASELIDSSTQAELDWLQQNFKNHLIRTEEDRQAAIRGKESFRIMKNLEVRIGKLLESEENREPWKDIDQDHLTTYDLKFLHKLLSEKAKRRIEGLRLYKPMPTQDAFHRCLLPERLLRGSNRSGKTVGGAIEVARAVTGQDPFKKYPPKDGRCYVVGYDGKHISKVMWPKLAKAGAFKIIRDEITGMWRTYDPTNPADLVRFRETKQAPPLIPPRYIKDIAWESKKEGLPKHIKLTTGWEIDFFSSMGKPQKGADIDMCWFDEEVEGFDWYAEMAARLIDRSGRFIWTATPQAGTEELYRLHERAEEQRFLPYKTTEEFVILLDDNKYITEEQKRQFAEKMSEEERVVRIQGEFAFSSFRVFPEFAKELHCTDYFQIPRSWTRYACVDPGRQVCAVLFLAIPRPDDGDFAYCYDELYIQGCDAETFGEKMAHKCQGQSFEAFLIDHQGGRVVEMGSGMSVEAQYSEALRKRRISSEVTGAGFAWGAPEPKAGVEAIRSWLKSRAADTKRDQMPKLRIFPDKCPNLIEEIKHYRYKRVSRVVTDDPESRGRVHLMACLRYLALYQPKWVRARTGKGALGGAILAFRDKMKNKKERAGPKAVNLGPGD
jgi:phage terminase large subunit-like protein